MKYLLMFPDSFVSDLDFYNIIDVNAMISQSAMIDQNTVF